jgi:hypothetical protein
MKSRIPVLAFLLVSIASIAGCSSDGPTEPGGQNGPANGSMTARIDGNAWTATIVTPGITGGISAIGGSDGSRTMAFAWAEGGPGTYQIGSSIGLNANLTIAGGTWVASAVTGSGTLTVATRTQNRITGTFNFTMNPGSGAASGTRAVTQGAFDITF